MSEKIRKKYYCEKCDYNTNDRKDWKKHILTRKHKMDKNYTKKSEKSANDNTMIHLIEPHKYICSICNRSYKFNSGLSRHMKKVHLEKTNFNSSEKLLLQQQQEQISQLQQLLKNTLENNKKTIDDLIPKLGNNTFNTTNNKMTINLFLNEHCKDAINLSDFLDQVKLSLEDLVYTKHNGYSKGISNIFVKHLNDLKPTERPIHCSDIKRLQFYVKDEDKWEKDTEHSKIDQSIQNITRKQIKKIKDWESKHPNWNEDDKKTDMYMSMIQQVMGSNDQEQLENIKRELGYTFDLKEAIENS